MSHLVTRVTDAQTAWGHWSLVSAEERKRRLSALSESLPAALSSGFDYQLTRAYPYVAACHNMPGPTGETNELYLCPRGVAMLVLCDSSEQGETAAGAMLAAMLLAGNSVLLCSDEDELNQQIMSAVMPSGLPAGLVQLCPVDSVAMLSALDISAAALVGNRQAQQDVNRQLAKREGAICTFVSETDLQAMPASHDPCLVLRFVTERTRTINITAVGGNASLLSLGNDSG